MKLFVLRISDFSVVGHCFGFWFVGFVWLYFTTVLKADMIWQIFRVIGVPYF